MLWLRQAGTPAIDTATGMATQDYGEFDEGTQHYGLDDEDLDNDTQLGCDLGDGNAANAVPTQAYDEDDMALGAADATPSAHHVRKCRRGSALLS